MAKKADQWIGIRPGTDGALALGMINVIVNEGLYDESFVQDWTTGFGELCDYAQQFPPEKVEKITRIPRDTISELARSIPWTPSQGELKIRTGSGWNPPGVE